MCRSYEAMAFGKKMSKYILGATKRTQSNNCLESNSKAQMTMVEDLKESSILRMEKLNTLKRFFYFSAIKVCWENLVMD